MAHAAAVRLFAATAVRLTVGSCAHAIARLRRSGARASDSTRGEGPCCASHARDVYASEWLVGRAGVLAECGRQPSDRQQSEYIRHARPARRRRRDQVLTRTIGCPNGHGAPASGRALVFFVRYALKLYSTSLRRWLLWCSLAIPEAETVKSVRTDALDAMGPECTRSDRFASLRIGSIGEAPAANRLC